MIEPDSIYFSFLLQVLAIVGAAGIVVALTARAGALAMAVATAGVALALLGGQYAIGARSAAKNLNLTRERFLNISDRPGGRTQCVNEPNLPDLNYIRFLQATLPPRSSFVLFLDPASRTAAVDLCIGQILLPRIIKATPEEAQYAVFFGLVPDAYARQARKGNAAYSFFTPDKGVLRLR